MNRIMFKKYLAVICLSGVFVTGLCQANEISAIVRAKMAFGMGGISQYQADEYLKEFKHHFKGFSGCHVEPIFGAKNHDDLKNWQLVCAFGALQGYFRFVPFYKVVEGVAYTKKGHKGD